VHHEFIEIRKNKLPDQSAPAFGGQCHRLIHTAVYRFMFFLLRTKALIVKFQSKHEEILLPVRVGYFLFVIFISSNFK